VHSPLPALLLLLLPVHQQQTSCIFHSMRANTDTTHIKLPTHVPTHQPTNPTHLFLWNLGFVLS
jgi:hypothetical protein